MAGRLIDAGVDAGLARPAHERALVAPPRRPEPRLRWLQQQDVSYSVLSQLTDRGVEAFKQSFGTAADRAAGRAQKIPLMTLWYGANDSVLEGRPQHVSENDYGMHLSEIMTMVTSENSEYYSPETKIILIGVTPIVEEDRHKGQLARWKEFGSKGEAPTLDRSLQHSEEYRDTPGMVVHECHEEDEPIVTLDAWGAIERAAGGREPDQLRPFFYWSEIDMNNVEKTMAPKPKADAGSKHAREEEDADVEQQKKLKN
ncbi:hypothetical protein A1Q2_01403 [Trichosporon asahii var. asahii CBS 8904]|uniref:SGNH hydrolase-type esterase domain-containing protein n=1 Tax=Trichosporon asahii var. asahii (strain CBS 8904) TaxID=1220162 RepID=K1VXX5_TRIAC|nr:hypothetical protein A1Q2_01403 [Trichosporon asahii var. asahii CBS 8904]